jgi:hypothetical protein
VAIIMRQTAPEGVTLKLLDEVTEEMDAHNDPPAGLIAHAHFEDGGRIQIVDFWESQQAYETFARDRLMPAMERVLSKQGVALPQPGAMPEDVVEVQTLVRGR